MELMQITLKTGITKCDEFITNCDRHYKVRPLLQIATGITKCDHYYKLRQALQSAIITTNCDSTDVLWTEVGLGFVDE